MKKGHALDPIMDKTREKASTEKFLLTMKGNGINPAVQKTREQASTEKLLLSMTTKLYEEIRFSNDLFRSRYGGPIVGNQMTKTASNFYDQGQLQDSRRSSSKHSRRPPSQRPPSIDRREYIQTRGEPKENLPIQNTSENIMVKDMILNLESRLKAEEEKNKALAENFALRLKAEEEEKNKALAENFALRLKAEEEKNKALADKLEKMEEQRAQQSTNIDKNIEKMEEQKASNILQKALKNQAMANMPNQGQQKKNNYGILTQILPYSDRRQIKVKFKIPDLVNLSDDSKKDELRSETTEWLGVVYRATASICWNMLSNAQLNFEEIKVLFTENIIFNFIQFFKEMQKTLNKKSYQLVANIISEKSSNVLEFLGKQYPQTKMESPNLIVRDALHQIANDGRIKFDLVYQSGINFVYRDSGDYTDLIMKMINVMIKKTDDQFDKFQKFMKEVFQQVYKPQSKRIKIQNIGEKKKDEDTDEHSEYKQKVKGYTSFKINRKIPRNTPCYSDEEINNGVFSVKSHAVLRIVTKWVEELKNYFDEPDKTILNSSIDNKNHSGEPLYITVLLKKGIHKKVLEQRQNIIKKLENIKRQCQQMEYLLTAEKYTSDSTQVHLSAEQIRVGMYSVNLKRVISSYICAQLNELIHFFLEIPRNVCEKSLGNSDNVFTTMARKDLDQLNLIRFNLFDLLRCKINSNEDEISWVIKHLNNLHHNRSSSSSSYNSNNRSMFSIVRVKDRLQKGTRDIMINGQLDEGLVCQIQLSVTNHIDKKQELLDSYNHFLYELKRAQLGTITENVSVWSNYEQRYAYFEALMTDKNRSYRKIRESPLKHQCKRQCEGDVANWKSFKRPIICFECKEFYPIPSTCLLNLQCQECKQKICGECYYYNYLDAQGRKKYIFGKLFRTEIMEKLIEYNDYNKPLPKYAFFIKKRFLMKELSFCMAIEKVKQKKVKVEQEKVKVEQEKVKVEQEKVKGAIEILITQTVIRDGKILNRQVHKDKIQAQLKDKDFYIKNDQKTELNNFLIFYFNDDYKEIMALTELKSELEKTENSKARVLSILKEPAYIDKIHLLKKENEKIKALNNIENLMKNMQLTVYKFPNFYLLAQVCFKGSVLRADILKKNNMRQLKSFAKKQSEIVSMEYKKMSNELENFSSDKKNKKFCQQLTQLYLSNGEINSIKCFQNFKKLKTVIIAQNKLTSLEGVQTLQFLESFTFDRNQVSSLLPLKNLSSLYSISGNKNKIKSLSGLEDLKKLRKISVYGNQIQSLEEIKNLNKLQTVIVRENAISDISVIQQMKKVKKLYIGATKVEQVPELSMLSNLKELSLDGLKLKEIPDIFLRINLHQITLSYNQIKQISNLEKQKELKYLSLTENQIQKMEGFENLDKLETLKLDKNKITVVEGLKNLDSLKLLRLQQNPLDDLGQLLRYDFSFRYQYTKDTMTENALKQLHQLQSQIYTVSQGDD